MGRERHWEDVYGAHLTRDLGWYEPKPSTLELVLRFSDPSDSVIDVGAGDSRLPDELVEAGYGDVTLLDLSKTALDRVRSRLGPNGRNVAFIEADVTRWEPPRRWDLWHDRAVFHFLVSVDDRQAYKATALRSLVPEGRMIVSTFAPDGPEQCAGLPVERYDWQMLAAVFSPEFDLVEHHDLGGEGAGVGDQRPYLAAVFQRH